MWNNENEIINMLRIFIWNIHKIYNIFSLFFNIIILLINNIIMIISQV